MLIQHFFFLTGVDITSSDEPGVLSCSYDDSLTSTRHIVTTESIKWALNGIALLKYPRADGI